MPNGTPTLIVPPNEDNNLLQLLNDDLRELLKKHQIKQFAMVYPNPANRVMLCFYFNPTVDATWTVNATTELANKMRDLRSRGKLGKNLLQ